MLRGPDHMAIRSVSSSRMTRVYNGGGAARLPPRSCSAIVVRSVAGSHHMPHHLRSLLALACVLAAASAALAAEEDDFYAANRETIRRGVQAMLMCNGLFTSQRSLEQVFAQELAYLEDPIGSAEGGDYDVRRDLRGVAVGTPDNPPVVRAVFREGLSCVVMAPGQDWDDVETLPRLDLPPPAGDPAKIPWPDGDLLPEKPLDPSIDARALEAAADWAFERESPEQVTLSLL